MISAIRKHQLACDKVRELLPAGPWSQEPDRILWRHAGLECLMLRNPQLFNWCGYVGLPAGHKFFGKNYKEITLDVHGRLSFGGKIDACFYFRTNESAVNELFWLGFDCAHYDDISPGADTKALSKGEWNLQSMSNTRTYKDMDFVKAETEKLADQLSGISMWHNSMIN